MTPASRLRIEPGDKVLDLCAAPGGKTTELGAKLQGKGFLLANDISAKRAKALVKNVELFGIPNVGITVEEPEDLGRRFPEYFDKILVDAPCSGEGMFRKESSMVKAWEQNGPEFYAPLQRHILESAIQALKPGGFLLYSTCTFSPLEDEGTVLHVLEEHPNLHITPMEGYEGFECGHPEWVNSNREELKNCVRIFPHKMQGEGHFLALFQKDGEREVSSSAIPRKKGKKENLNREEKELWESFYQNITMEIPLDQVVSKKGFLFALPEELRDKNSMRYQRSGLFLGEVKKKRFEPSQALAMALKSSQYRGTLSLNVEDERVIRYLKGETIVLTKEEQREIPDNGTRYLLICVDGYPLGWGKDQKGTVKNKYLPGWRMM